MAKKNYNLGEKWGLNLASLTEKEAKDYINQLREEKQDETVILQFLEDVKKIKGDLKKMNEDKKNMELLENEENDPLKVVRTKLPNGAYAVKSCSFQQIKRTDDDYNITINLKMKAVIEDIASGITRSITVNYVEPYFNALFEKWSKFFIDEKPQNLYDCIQLAKENVWYIEKKINRGFENWNPLSYLPMTDNDAAQSNYQIVDL